MDGPTAETTNRSSAQTQPRPWRRLHASTYVVLLFTSAVLFLLNVPGQYVPYVGMPLEEEQLFGDHPIVRERLEHGWPFSYLIRNDRYFDKRSLEYELRPTAVWSFTEDFVAFNGWAAVGDVVAALSLIGIVALLADYWRRQRSAIWQLRVSDLFGLTAIIAGAIWYALCTWRDYEAELTAMRKLGLHVDEDGVRPLYVDTSIRTRGGPTWLRTLIGEVDFPRFFDRLIYTGADDTDLQQLAAFKSLRGLVLFLDKSGPSDVGLSDLTALEAIEFEFHSGRRSPWGGSTEAEPDRLESLLVPFLNSLETLPKLWLVQAVGDGIGDRSAKVLAGLPKLRAVSFTGCRLTNDGLGALTECSSLEELWLREMEISVEGLVQLRQLPILQTLSLRGTWLPGASFEQLSKLGTLKRLDLERAMMNEAGLHSLVDMPSLEYLSLPDFLETAIVADLKRRLPKARIIFLGAEVQLSDDSNQ